MIPGLLHIWGGEGERDAPEDEQEEVDEDQEDEPDEDESDEDESDDADDKAKGKKKKSSEPTLEEKYEASERARLKLERQIAREKKAAEEAEGDKDVVKDRDKYKAKAEARDKFLAENLLQIEVIKQKKFDFIDVEDVVAALQRDEDVHIDLDADTPSVEGLDIALKRLAKKKPHWLKKDKEEQEEPGPRSGGHPRGGKTEDQESEDARIGAKFKIPGYGTQVQRVM